MVYPSHLRSLVFAAALILAAHSALAQPEPTSWSGQFAEPGLGMGCLAITTGNGRLYCANGFDAPGYEFSALLGIWDGTEWRYEGPGNFSTTSGHLNAIAVVGTDVYLGGIFSVEDANGQEITNLARWDGEAWHALGTGVNGEVTSLATTGSGDLYVGGTFTNAGGLEANNVARWDGFNWSVLEDGAGPANGTNGRVTALIVGNSAVYVGGSFSTAGGQNASRIAKWDWTTPAWSTLGAGVTDDPRDIAVSADGELYVAGDGDLIADAGVTASGIAKWDGSSWEAVGSGAPFVTAVEAAPNGEIFAAGDFSADAGAEAVALAGWDGTQWQAISDDDSFPSMPPFDIAALGGEIFVAGNEFFFEDMRTNGVAHWHDSEWSGLGEGVGHPNPAALSQVIRTLEFLGNDLYAGGMFEFAGPDSAASIARWTGSGWQPLNEGLSKTSTTPTVLALESFDGRLYVGGDFTHAGGVTAGGVASWNTFGWSTVGGGVEIGLIQDFVVYDNDLYATGSFDIAGGETTKEIARWDGSSWSAVGGGLGGTGYALTTHGGSLVVGGNLFYANGAFGDAGAFEVNNLARWDGAAWHDVGDGVNGPVYALASDGTNVYAGGQFTEAGGGVAVNNIAMWDGSTWTAMGSGFDGPVRTLLVNGTDVYAGGDFATAGGVTAGGLARWNGTEWSAVDSGLHPNNFSNARGVYALEGSDEGLFVGGTFGFAGDVNSLNIALWTDFELQSVSAERDPFLPGAFALHPNYPNPFAGRTEMAFDVAKAGHVSVRVFDVLGRQVALLVNGVRSPGRHTIAFDADRLPSGTYFVKATSAGYHQTRPITIAR